MYSGMIVEYNDQSDIPVNVPVTEVRNKPLFGAVFSSDKGPEDWMRLSGEDFFKTYGDAISFRKHGQPLLQTAMSVNAGAEVLCKRLVADDATLANIGIVVSLSVESNSTEVQVQVTDDEGNLLYLDDNGAETTEVTNTPYMRTETSEANKNTITYSIVSATKAKTIKDAKTEIEKSLTEGQKLLYVLSDNGRGVSKKRIKITPNYKLSKSLSYVVYSLSVMEGSKELESMNFSINPDLIVSGINISLQSMVNTYSTQIKCLSVDENIEWLAKTINDSADGNDSIYKHDILFACTNRGEPISSSVAVSSNGVDLKNVSGQKLDGGSNGAFGDCPFSETAEYHVTDTDGNLLYLNSEGKETTVAEGNTPVTRKVREEYIKQGVDALTGAFDTVIFNVDQYMLSAFVDANYPDEMKTAIAALANFREDFIFFRDMGLNKTDFDLINTTNANIPTDDKSMFCATYCQSYDVIDPYTKKQITVTIGYDLAQKLVGHCNNGCILPTAGIKYDMVIDNAIYGTLSFAPTICPDELGYEGNQKEKLDDLHINYAAYINNQLVIESLYTSQEKNSQWSYINNVMGIQEVVKTIRTRCPAIRYTFIDGEDLERYKADIEDIIAPYQNNFKHLSVEYVSDTTYSANKIFYAALKVVYKDFVQTEWFKVTALSTVEVVE